MLLTGLGAIVLSTFFSLLGVQLIVFTISPVCMSIRSVLNQPHPWHVKTCTLILSTTYLCQSLTVLEVPSSQRVGILATVPCDMSPLVANLIDVLSH